MFATERPGAGVGAQKSLVIGAGAGTMTALLAGGLAALKLPAVGRCVG